jgi:excisionase family DNA binding protein
MTRTKVPNGLTRLSAEPEFLSRGEVARLFGVSLSTVTRWARTGLLPTVRTPGGHYRYRAEDMRQAARRVGAITNTN